jgi:hypothetical protein
VCLAAKHHLRSAIARVLHEVDDLVVTRLVDHRTDHERLMHALINTHLGNLLLDRGDEPIMDAALHINAVGRNADLTGVPDRPPARSQEGDADQGRRPCLNHLKATFRVAWEIS